MALTVAGSTIAGTKAVYDYAGAATAIVSDAITAACRDWDIRHAASQQRVADGVVTVENAQKASDLALWAETTCDPSAPPPKDPIAGAVWLIGIARQVEALTATQAPK